MFGFQSPTSASLPRPPGADEGVVPVSSVCVCGVPLAMQQEDEGGRGQRLSNETIRMTY